MFGRHFSKSSKSVLLFGLALSVAMPIYQAEARDQKRPTLMDLFFKKKAKKPVKIIKPAVKRVAKQRKVQKAKPVKQVKREKISAPQVYTYKADALKTLSAKNIKIASSQQLALGAFTGGVLFSDALRASGDFSLPVESDIAKTVQAFYATRPDFLWVEGFHISSEAKRVLAVLNDADTYGLESADYKVDVPSVGFNIDAQQDRARDLLAFELSLSAKALRYVQDVEGRRIDPNRLSGYHDLPNKVPALDSVLSSFADSTRDDELLLNMHPREKVYQSLRKTLAALKSASDERMVLSPKIFLKPGQSHAEFPQILALIEKKASPSFREKHFFELNLARGTQTYSPSLVPLIKDWQKERGLGADGVIGPRTIAKTTDRSRAGEITKVKLALERMRWLPDQYGSKHVFINQPAYRVDHYENDERTLSMRVVIGKKSNQTNFFYDEIETVVYNPYWGVPQSILVNEMLPKLRRNPSYLDNNGYEVTTTSGKRLSSSQVNWSQFGNRVPLNVRQKPGARNALGELKILFPNKHAIYMHDTPAKSLFSRATRAFSHGCVRLSDPRAMAGAILGVSKAEIGNRIANGAPTSRLKVKVPVYLGYFTAWQDEQGAIAFYDDIYGRDANVLKALESVRKVRNSGV